jgi:predicted helicase
VASIRWRELIPDAQNNWLVPEHAEEFTSFLPLGSKAGKNAEPAKARVLFKEYSLGVATHRDSVVYDFDKNVGQAGSGI